MSHFTVCTIFVIILFILLYVVLKTRKISSFPKTIPNEAKFLFEKYNETIKFGKTHPMRQNPTLYGWNVTPPVLTGMDQLAEEKYTLNKTFQPAAIKYYMIQLVTGQYKECQEISTIPRTLGTTFEANGVITKVVLTDWKFIRDEQTKKWKAVKNKGTIGTSYREIQTEFSNHLKNSYSTRVNTNTIFRSGWIDSSVSGQQFFEMVKAAIPNNTGTSKIRVCSISFLRTVPWSKQEDKPLLYQHKFLHQLNSEQTEFEFLHFNIPFGVIGLWGIYFGEAVSQNMNKDGIATLEKWFREDTDIKKDETLLQFARRISAKDNTLKHRAILLNAIKVNNDNVNFKTKVEQLGALSCYLILSKIAIATNCKSGTDRTGGAFALILALCQILQSRPNELDLLVDVVINFDDIQRNIKTTFTSKYNISNEMKLEHQIELWDKFITDLSQIQHPNYTEKSFLLLIELKNCMFSNLMNVSIPVTVFSSCVGGLKFGKQTSRFRASNFDTLMPYYFISDGIVYSQDNFRLVTTASSYLRGT
ncbi:hypothetical protein EIN_222990 [Entamoeba invadens IP1]|uniref:Uncharacterized protein n=1 Tax=Entamoeba invadens IP1 TaxID=370355 RepID=A0A0A1U234_ENTIV|nr:hypothetical protein EIN_222990 [Entamoeba invadens IP1]ELP88126.1 hypothetical protein EIN_222990 [Entamoeba invadens IP1]|eukprot:XP_004254897.1 hypothetical protein EIN_222990 [Entamoeba invadens IP1]